MRMVGIGQARTRGRMARSRLPGAAGKDERFGIGENEEGDGGSNSVENNCPP